MPRLGSDWNDRPGALIVPSKILNGANIPPRPVRSSELVNSEAMSDRVGFAHDVAMTVNGTTGLVGGRAYTPALLRGIVYSCCNSLVVRVVAVGAPLRSTSATLAASVPTTFHGFWIPPRNLAAATPLFLTADQSVSRTLDSCPTLKYFINSLALTKEPVGSGLPRAAEAMELGDKC